MHLILLDLTVIFSPTGTGGLHCYDEVPEVLAHWQAQGASIVPLAPDEAYAEAWRSMAPQYPVWPTVGWVQWRQVDAWRTLCTQLSRLPSGCRLFTARPAWLAAAETAGIRGVGILRDPHTMAALSGTWLGLLPIVAPENLISGDAESIYPGNKKPAV